MSDSRGQAKGKTRRQRRRKGMCLADRPVLEQDAAGIDVGAREMFVAVPPDRDTQPVRVFDTFTEDLQRLADVNAVRMFGFEFAPSCLPFFVVNVAKRELRASVREMSMSI